MTCAHQKAALVYFQPGSIQFEMKQQKTHTRKKKNALKEMCLTCLILHDGHDPVEVVFHNK